MSPDSQKLAKATIRPSRRTTAVVKFAIYSGEKLPSEKRFSLVFLLCSHSSDTDCNSGNRAITASGGNTSKLAPSLMARLIVRG